ncbi:hypothetical protein SEUBUCD646_0K00110 [Saccharomyces eubayanus]|uniref:Uncharacterized protein n=1 Tax=Saccharomyces eubayanus TaxID=1080349 RepID=A0ABN8VI67_SACEU|nr:hypothetical protein SEUBUCD650_0K00110 [Saccharomyces eubayanus]CAI1549981.1 hypothetical protein SEUBUCD646_0K00110 [Saccharomyces eubayanus]
MEDAKLEYEKSVGSFSSKCLETQSIALPKDVFRSSFTWFYYGIYKSFAFRIWLVLWLLIIFWQKLSNDWLYPFMASRFVLLGLIPLPYIVKMYHKCALSKQVTQRNH